MRVPARLPSVTISWLGPCRGPTAVDDRLPRRRAGGVAVARTDPLSRRSARITRMHAKTNNHSSARKPKRISCSARAEFIPPRSRRRRSPVGLLEHETGVADAHHVAVPEDVAADVVPVDVGAVG